MQLTPIISLDLETTGLDPTRHVPWEIAWITAVHFWDPMPLKGGPINEVRVVDSHRAFLPIGDSAGVDLKALEISKFHQRYRPDEVKQPVYVLDALGSMINDCYAHARAWSARSIGPDGLVPTMRGMHLIGACPQFDHRMLERWLGWAHTAWHYHLVDIETLAAGALAEPPPYNTDRMTEQMLGHTWDSSRKHEAMADCEWNLAMYCAALRAPIPKEVDRRGEG